MNKVFVFSFDDSMTLPIYFCDKKNQKHWQSLIHQGQAVAIIRSVAESIENVEKVLILAQDIQQPAVELRSLELTISSGKNWEKKPGDLGRPVFWA